MTGWVIPGALLYGYARLFATTVVELVKSRPFFPPLSILLCGFSGLMFSPLVACSLSDRDANDTAITVGARRITVSQLKEDIAFIAGVTDLSALQWNQIGDRLIDQVINHYLVMEYGKKNGISISQNEIETTMRQVKEGYTEDAFQDALLRGYTNTDEWNRRVREQLLVNKIIEKVTAAIDSPSDQAIMEYFKENQDDFKTPPMVTFRQIVTRTKQEAHDLLKRLHNGETMSELAKAHSITPEAEKGGKVEWIAGNHLDKSMAKALFSMPEGKFSQVVKTPYGYHIFQVLSVRSAGKRELPEVISEIENKLLREKREAFLEEWLEDLRNHIRVKINKVILNSMEFS